MVDIYPPDFTSDLGLVRALIPDIEQLANPARPSSVAEYIFHDAHLNGLLAMNKNYTGQLQANYVRLAAADACSTLGTSEAFVLKVIQTEDLKSDASKLMTGYLARAKELRDEAMRIDNGEVMDFLNTINPYTFLELSGRYSPYWDLSDPYLNGPW